MNSGSFWELPLNDLSFHPNRKRSTKYNKEIFSLMTFADEPFFPWLIFFFKPVKSLLLRLFSVAVFPEGTCGEQGMPVGDRPLCIFSHQGSWVRLEVLLETPSILKMPLA